MRSILRKSVLAISLVASTANAVPIVVGTAASATATYGTVSQSAGPFPWNDLGITASASVTPGVLNVSTGGATSFSLNTTVTGGESFVPGSTVLNVGYTPAWTGAFGSAPAGSGNLASDFVYHIGPFNGSLSLLNVPLAIPGANSGNLTSSLNAPFAPPVIASQTVGGPGVGLGFGVQAQACFIVCVTVASANVSFNVGTQIQQTVVASPTVTYGNLVWESTTPTFSPTASFVPGAFGNIANTFTAPPASLGLTSGQTFYYNFLPVVQLDMPVANDAQVDVPASISASYNIFGFGGSKTWPLGNLYSLDGNATFDFNPTFDGSEFYSIPLVYTPLDCSQKVACFGPTFTVLPTFTGPDLIGGGGIPGGSGPCGALLIGCAFNLPTGGGLGGYGDTNLGPLIPGDPGLNVCAPVGTPFAGKCINSITQTFSQVPEPRSDTLLAIGIGLLGLGLARRRILSARHVS